VACHPWDQMTTLSETQTQAPRSPHLRAYLAGTGATGALIAGAVIVFLSLATYVAFNGIPFGGNGGNSGNTFVGVQTGGTPAAAAAALGAAPGAVAAAPVPGAPIGAGGPGAFGGGGAGGTGAAGGPGGGGLIPGGGPGPGTTPPGGGPGPGPGGGPAPAPVPSGSPGVVGNTINQIDDTAGTNLSGGPVGDVGGTVDDKVTGTVNDVGGKVGQPGLGDKVTGDVNDTVNGIVGGLPGK
jgi:hypothetical protein